MSKKGLRRGAPKKAEIKKDSVREAKWGRHLEGEGDEVGDDEETKEFLILHTGSRSKAVEKKFSCDDIFASELETAHHRVCQVVLIEACAQMASV